MKIEAANTDAWNIAKGKNPEKPTVLRFRPSLEAHLGDENYPRRLAIIWQFETAGKLRTPIVSDSAGSLNRSMAEHSLLNTFFQAKGKLRTPIVSDSAGSSNRSMAEHSLLNTFFQARVKLQSAHELIPRCLKANRSDPHTIEPDF